MSAEVVKKYRTGIPAEHMKSMDTMIQWLWHQRFGTIQRISLEAENAEVQTVCSLFLQAIMAKDLNSIKLILDRMEGGAILDQEAMERLEDEEPMGSMPV